MIKYRDTKSLLQYIRALMQLNNIALKDVAINMNKTQGATSALFKQENISLDALKEICDAINCDLEINIVPKDNNLNTMSNITGLSLAQNFGRHNDQ